MARILKLEKNKYAEYELEADSRDRDNFHLKPTSKVYNSEEFANASAPETYEADFIRSRIDKEGLLCKKILEKEKDAEFVLVNIAKQHEKCPITDVLECRKTRAGYIVIKKAERKN